LFAGAVGGGKVGGGDVRIGGKSAMVVGGIDAPGQLPCRCRYF